MSREKNRPSSDGEDFLVAQLLSQWPVVVPPVVVGPGDDCAVIAQSNTWQLLKTDAMVEGQHFLSNENMRRVGWKAIARVQSDFAAMGGIAEALVVNIFLPPQQALQKSLELYQGMADAARIHGGILCGGETSRSPDGAGLLLSIAGTGRCHQQPILRSGAQCGHHIFVTGVLGGSLAGHHLDFSPRVDHGQWLAKSGVVTAMMDLSDGLAKDLPRMCKQSNIGAIIDHQALPCRDGCNILQALSDGEDYELLFTVAAEQSEKLQHAWAQAFPDLRLTRIGHCVATDESMSFSGGWDPFA